MNSGTHLVRAVAATALLVMALVGCGLQPSERVTTPVGRALSHALIADVARPAPVAKVAPAADAPIGSLTVRAVDLRFAPSTITVASPGRYRVRFQNDDALPHDLLFLDGTVLSAAPGEVAEGEVLIGAAGVSFICDLAGHRDAGMIGQIYIAP
ncbi:MAG: hypothetical protein OHK0015_53400 [Chloroflexi bacterium OHK40]